jgi:hypothetical protein
LGTKSQLKTTLDSTDGLMIFGSDFLPKGTPSFESIFNMQTHKNFTIACGDELKIDILVFSGKSQSLIVITDRYICHQNIRSIKSSRLSFDEFIKLKS